MLMQPESCNTRLVVGNDLFVLLLKTHALHASGRLTVCA